MVGIGERVKAYREAQNLSQRDLGVRAGVSQSYIYLLEKGVQNVTLLVFRQIAEGLGVSMAELLYFGSGDLAPSEDSLVHFLDRLEKGVDTSEARRQAEEAKVREMKELAADVRRFLDGFRKQRE